MTSSSRQTTHPLPSDPATPETLVPGGFGAAAGAATPPAETVPPAHPDHPSADGEPGRDDGPLDSLGKAISSPIAGAAEDEEPA